MAKNQEVGLIIVGDEILSGKRIDQHFENSKKILSDRGIPVGWVVTLGDEKKLCERFLRFSFSNSKSVVFCFGGIGSTPDDNTRHACAEALGLNLTLNPEAEKLIRSKFKELNTPITPERLQMGEFPLGSELIPNPFNNIPGFSIQNHYFLPGFPQMAKPMMEWILDSKYQNIFCDFVEIEYFLLIDCLYESSITPVLKKIVKNYPNFNVYSLPHSVTGKMKKTKFTLEVGIKMSSRYENLSNNDESLFNKASDELKKEIELLGGIIISEGRQTR